MKLRSTILASATAFGMIFLGACGAPDRNGAASQSGGATSSGGLADDSGGSSGGSGNGGSASGGATSQGGSGGASSSSTAGAGGNSAGGAGGSSAGGSAGNDTGGTTAKGGSGGSAGAGGGSGGNTTASGGTTSRGGSGGSGGSTGSSAGGSGGNGTTASGGSTAKGGSGGSAGAGGTNSTGGTTSTGTGPTGPCDIYQTANTPCGAAHSTVRALYASYNGPLYQVQRASDKTTKDIMVGSAGFADSASQDSFCSGTTCTIPIIYDQSPNGNHLRVTSFAYWLQSGGNPATANAARITVGGHTVYGIKSGTNVAYHSGVPLSGTGSITNGSQDCHFLEPADAPRERAAPLCRERQGLRAELMAQQL